MFSKIKKWGNSQGLRLTKNVLSEADLKVGEEVEVFVRDGSIVISSRNRKRGKHDLNDLISQIPEDYQPGEVDWGKPEGREGW